MAHFVVNHRTLISSTYLKTLEFQCLINIQYEPGTSKKS